MAEVLREWTEQIMFQEAAVRETHLRLVIRDRPRWLPNRVWRWAIGKLLVLEESRDLRDLRDLREAVDRWDRWDDDHSAAAMNHPFLPLVAAARALLAAERAWLCIERGPVNVGISNQPGSPGHCYFTSTPSHLEECGPVIMVRVEE